MSMVRVASFLEAKKLLGLKSPISLADKTAAARAAKMLVTAALGRIVAEKAAINPANVAGKMESIQRGKYAPTRLEAPKAKVAKDPRALKEMSTIGIELLRKGLLKATTSWTEWFKKLGRSKRIANIMAARVAANEEASLAREAKRAAWVARCEKRAFAGSFARKAKTRELMLLNKIMGVAA